MIFDTSISDFRSYCKCLCSILVVDWISCMTLVRLLALVRKISISMLVKIIHSYYVTIFFTWAISWSAYMKPKSLAEIHEIEE